MSQKVAALEQEVERLTDGAELENVSPQTSNIQPFWLLCVLSCKHFWTHVLCSWNEISNTWSLSWRGRSVRVPPMWQRSERWVTSISSSAGLVILSHFMAGHPPVAKNKLCCLSPSCSWCLFFCFGDFLCLIWGVRNPHNRHSVELKIHMLYIVNSSVD